MSLELTGLYLMKLKLQKNVNLNLIKKIDY
jgi:hypothetical protein